MALSRQPAVSACCSLIWSLRSLPASLSWPDVGLTLTSTWDPALTPRSDSVATVQTVSCITEPEHLLKATCLIMSLARLSATGGQAHAI